MRINELFVAALAIGFLSIPGLSITHSITAYAQASGDAEPVMDVPPGYKIVGGDILVSALVPGGAYATNLWPDGIVPYEFHTNVTPDQHDLMIEAMAAWEAVANVSFVPRDGQSNYIIIQDANRNASAVGMVGNEQPVLINTWYLSPVHELGHTLGLWHEHSRPDRDTFVTIEWDRILPESEDDFVIQPSAFFYGEYDFDSVMHYGQCAMSACGEETGCLFDPASCRTITVNPPWQTEWQDEIGQRTRISRLDALTMSMLYPESNWVFVDQSHTGAEEGTFFNPFRSIQSAFAAVEFGGTIIIQPGSYDEIGRFAKAVTFRAPLGGVVIGQ